MEKRHKDSQTREKRQTKIILKRTTHMQKLVYILQPFVVYMVVKTVAMLVLALLVPALPITGLATWIEQHSRQLSAAVNGVASMIAVYFVLNDFLIEVNISGEIDIDKGIIRQFFRFLKKGFFGNDQICVGTEDEKRKRWSILHAVGCIVLGAIAACILNFLIGWIATIIHNRGILGSQKYETVETIQYSVPLWMGIILYGLISPMVEEMVFRGVLYGRIKRFYGVARAVIFSSLLFGLFHANLPQFVYGSIMGGLIAVCYEYMGCFAAPVLVHMSANIFVYLLTSVKFPV